MVDYVWRNGARLTPWMNYQINRLSAACFKRWGCYIIVSSGVRLESEQIVIFTARYVTAGNIRGRKVYDMRWWNGQWWYRISSAGTVAAPNSPQANHQIRGTVGAVDIRDTGSDAGIMSKNSPRGKWIRQVCREYDLEPEGDGFNEGWHFKVLNVHKAVPSTPSGGGSKPIEQEKVMVKPYARADAKANAGKRSVNPGSGFWLHIDATQPDSKASNIIGGVGPYSFVVHVYAEGTPGDAVEVKLQWDDYTTSGPHSDHYTERLVIPAGGKLRSNFSFQNEVGSTPKGTAVYARMDALETNKAPVKVTKFATDSWLFV